MNSILQAFKKNSVRPLALRVFVVLFLMVSAVAMPSASTTIEGSSPSFSLVGGSLARAWDCTLVANPATITAGGSTTLSWTTINSTSGSIDNGVGAMTPVASGSTSASPIVDTTYTATVLGPEGSITCSVPVVVTAAPSPLRCDSFSVTPSSVDFGGTTTLQWETTGATSVTIDNNVGSVALDGITTMQVQDDTVYTLTASRGAETATCSATATVAGGQGGGGNGGGGGGGGGGSSSPRCDLFRASDTSVRAGERVTLNWETRRGSELRITDDRDNELFKTSDDEEADKGEMTVLPVRDTRYTLTVSRGSRDDACSVNVDIGGNGGSNVSLTLDPPDQQPLTSISLSQLPYTGFDAGPFLSSVFYTLLVLWSVGIAYVLVIKRGSVFGFALRSRQERLSAEGSMVLPHAEYQAHMQYPQMYAETAVQSPVATFASSVPVDLPTGVYGYGGAGYGSVALATEEDENAYDNETETSAEVDEEVGLHLEERAHQHNLLLSSDAIRLIMDHTDSKEEQMAFLDDAIARAKEAYPREDGWIVVNSERLKALFAEEEVAPVVSDTTEEETPHTEMRDVVRETVGASSLAEAVVTGNIAMAHSTLGNSPMAMLADAAADLDAVYRARRGEQTAPSDMLMRAASGLTDVQIEAAIAALTSAIDGIYQDEGAAVRLAVMKAIKATTLNRFQ